MWGGAGDGWSASAACRKGGPPRKGKTSFGGILLLALARSDPSAIPRVPSAKMKIDMPLDFMDCAAFAKVLTASCLFFLSTKTALESHMLLRFNGRRG